MRSFLTRAGGAGILSGVLRHHASGVVRDRPPAAGQVHDARAQGSAADLRPPAELRLVRPAPPLETVCSQVRSRHHHARCRGIPLQPQRPSARLGGRHPCSCAMRRKAATQTFDRVIHLTTKSVPTNLSRGCREGEVAEPFMYVLAEGATSFSLPLDDMRTSAQPQKHHAMGAGRRRWWSRSWTFWQRGCCPTRTGRRRWASCTTSQVSVKRGTPTCEGVKEQEAGHAAGSRCR